MRPSVTSSRYVRAALSARRLRGLLDELALDRDLYLLTDHDPAVQDRVETQPEFLPVDLRRGAVGDPVAHHPLVVELPVPGHVQPHRASVSLDGQCTGQCEPVRPAGSTLVLLNGTTGY